MAHTGRQDRSAATRAKVLVAAKALFESVGYDRASWRTIAQAAGVGTSTLLSVCSDKADLYREVFGHAPVTPEMGRALYLAARSGADPDRLAALVAAVEEA
jgi:AcrR family transcriptional regulator